MEKFLLRENVLVGQSPRRSFGSPKTQLGNSDVNFHDVFGGPPRRSSLQDRRTQSLGESMWFREEEEGEEETSSSRDVWSDLREKPVFGDEFSSRQRYPSDDFFDDIFRSDESSESAPRKSGWDASRVGNPGRLHSDPFASSSLPPTLSLPTKLANDNEYPAFSATSHRSRKNSENSPLALGFPSSPSVSTSRFSSQVIQGQDGLKNDMQYNHCQSSLSREFSLNSRGSSQATTSDKQETEGFLKNGSSSLEVSDSNSQFHFSIYKWASTGLPVVMPLREGNSLSFKRREKPEKGMTDFPALVQQDSRDQDGNLVLNMKNDRVDTYEVVSAKPVSQPLTGFQNIVNEIPMKIDSSESMDKRIPTSKQEAQKPELSPLYSLLINDSDRQGKEIKHGFGAFVAAQNKVLSESTEKKSPISNKVANDLEPNPMYCLLTDDSDRKANICEPERLEKSKFVSKKKGQKPEANALYCLLGDELGRQGNDKAVKQGIEGKTKSANTSAERVESHKKEKKQNGKKNKSSPINSSLKDLAVNREEKVGGNKIKGKVKSFVKIFNRESPSKPIVNSEALDNSASVKDGGSRTEDRESIDAVKIHQEEKMDQIQKQSEKPHVEVSTAAWKQSEKPQVEVNTAARKQLEKPQVEVITASLKQLEKTQVEVNTEAQKQSERPKVEVKTAERKIYTVSSAEPIRESTEATTNVDEFPDLNCTIKELPDDQNKQPQSDQPTEDLQVWDAKIRKWSNGKEHNIRSLLSTLQYVLWPESGWKPVPLADIIEGNPVKKAYQKALLCLHPDKLQQKGAAPHQKYIAERVFDILQEAWTQFNSLG